MGRNRRAKRQRRSQQRLPVLPILDEADLNEADPDTPVSLEVEHAPSDVVYCPRCSSILGMLLTDEEGMHLLGCAIGFIVCCTFCHWPVSPRLLTEREWERCYGAFWDYYDRVVSWQQYTAATGDQDSQPEIS